MRHCAHDTASGMRPGTCARACSPMSAALMASIVTATFISAWLAAGWESDVSQRIMAKTRMPPTTTGRGAYFNYPGSATRQPCAP